MDNEYDITNTINMILIQYIDNEYYITNTINMTVCATPVCKTRTPVCNTSIQQYDMIEWTYKRYNIFKIFLDNTELTALIA